MSGRCEGGCDMTHRSLGLRERKKEKARAAIQLHTLRLFREQGYEATTVRQIAEAAELSESTFFRYFASKEDVLRWDELDPLILEVFKEQPAGTGPIRALRTAFHTILTGLSGAEREDLRGSASRSSCRACPSARRCSIRVAARCGCSQRRSPSAPGEAPTTPLCVHWWVRWSECVYPRSSRPQTIQARTSSS